MQLASLLHNFHPVRGEHWELAWQVLFALEGHNVEDTLEVDTDILVGGHRVVEDGRVALTGMERHVVAYGGVDPIHDILEALPWVEKTRSPARMKINDSEPSLWISMQVCYLKDVSIKLTFGVAF